MTVQPANLQSRLSDSMMIPPPNQEILPPASRPGMTITQSERIDAELHEVSDAGMFSGYASVFGKTDLSQDIVMPGAFNASLAKRGIAGVKLLYQHDPAEPIGFWTAIEEDRMGLRVEGQLILELTRAREIHALMRAGVIDGLSIGFKTVRARKDARSNIRRLFEIDLWEISIVTFPMLPDARIGSVKARSKPTIREVERLLTHNTTLTRSEARDLVQSGYQTLASARDAAVSSQNESLADRFRRLSHSLKSTR